MLDALNISDVQIKTKLHRQQVSLVERVNLLERFDRLSKVKLLLLIAPPGFGKTVLITQWVERLCASDALVLWPALDEMDGEPREILISLLVLLRRAGNKHVLKLKFENLGADELVSCTNKAVAEEKRRVCIVLDDYHFASNAAIDKILKKFVQFLPGNVQVILASRKWPGVGIRQLLASEIAGEIDAGKLLFSKVESLEILEIGASDPVSERLLNDLEGWPIALSFTRLAIRERSGAACSIKDLVSRGSHLSAYFASELLGYCSDEQVDFLLYTSIFERFDIAIADAIRGQEDSWKLMDSLDFLKPLILRMEGEGDWYCYHHLFAGYLRRVFQERHPVLCVQLHVRASNAFLERGFFVDAVRHAAEAGDFERCANIISGAGGWKMVLYGRGKELACALECIPAKQSKKYPCIIAANAYLQLRAGNPHAANKSLCAFPGFFNQDVEWKMLSDDDLDVFNVKIFLQGYEDNELTLDFFRWGQEQQKKIQGVDSLTCGVLENTLAVAAISVGKFAEAEALATRAVRTMGEAGSVLAPGHCYLHAGLAVLHMGDTQLAAMHLAHAANMVNEAAHEGCCLKKIIGIVQENLQLWHWNQPIKKENCETILQYGGKHDGWFDVFIAAFDTVFRSAWIYGDVAAMEQALRIGRNIANERSIRKFRLIVNAFFLVKLVEDENRCQARKLALALMDELPFGVWQQSPHLWRPFQEVGFALFRFFLMDNAVINFSLVEDLLRCAIEVKHVPYQIRALLARAVLRDRNGQRHEALVDVFEVVEMASRNDLQLPFVEQPELETLLRLLQRKFRQMSGHYAIGELFVSNVLDARRAISRERNSSSFKNLSSREMEVAIEVGMGRTNKEIAQSLDLTVHTVKFHLRNIFAKFGVERRAHVQSLLSEQKKDFIIHQVVD